jgi:hypothetical protein
VFRARRQRHKREQGEAEEFAHRLAELTADMDEHPPTIVDLRELQTRLRRVHAGTHELQRSTPKQRS